MRTRAVLVSLLCLLPALAQAQEVVKPYMMLIVDNSGSMDDDCGGTPPNNSCGWEACKIYDAQCVVQKIIQSYGDVVFGLERFAASTCSGSCNWDDLTCNTTAAAGQIVVPIEDSLANVNQIINWADATCEAGTCAVPTPSTWSTLGPARLGAETNTPIAGSLRAARCYFEQDTTPVDANCAGAVAWTSPMNGDTDAACRPYSVVLLTDGGEYCPTTTTQLDGRLAIWEMRHADPRFTGGPTRKDIKTYVIGFGVSAPDPNVEQNSYLGRAALTACTATSQCTTALGAGWICDTTLSLCKPNNNTINIPSNPAPGSGGRWGYYASDETTLSLAFSQIIADSLLVEKCDGLDNDCDGAPDEDFDLGVPCDGTDTDTCNEGVTICLPDGTGTQCNDTTGNAVEVCNDQDDDCDGLINEGGVCSGCSFEPEICDNLDNDCDTFVDETLTRTCGVDEGLCTSGTQTCTAGAWSLCSGVNPVAEVCDGLDNDCDGMVDGMASDCGYPAVGQCVPGSQICTMGVPGPCIGGVGPSAEICDNIDNDCDGTVDNGDPGGGGACGTVCGVGTLHCVGGTLTCVATGTGTPETCNGFDDDCNGVIDDGLPSLGPCTVDDEGNALCIAGEQLCVAGEYHCVGGIPPTPEACDCLDNDCDGSSDEVDTDPLCPTDSTCLSAPSCQCARPCQSGEFPCPAGRMCVTLTEGDFCLVDPCYGVNCPAIGGVGRVCVSGSCVDICTTVTCTAPAVCRQSDGACVPDNCTFIPGKCTATQLCVSDVCVDDPCAGISCTSPQYCFEGACVGSCAGVACDEGQHCVQGICVDDPCADVVCTAPAVCVPETATCSNLCATVSCGSNQICDPATGNCVTDPCTGVNCPAGEVCHGGSCYSTIDAGPRTYVAAGGGGGCRTGGGGGAFTGLILLGLLGLTLRRRSR